MKTYRLDQIAFVEKRKAIYKKGIIFITLIFIFWIVVTAINSSFDWRVFLIMIPLVGGAGYVGLRRGVRIQKAAWESYELDWDNETLIKCQLRTKDVTIHKDEIQEVVDRKDGVVIKTAKKSNFIFIPKELEQFSEFVHELKTLITSKAKDEIR